MSTAERRLEIIRILCKRRYITMKNLANEFGVSIRSIQRDIDELTFLVPLYVKSGRYKGGVYIEESYIMERMYMTIQELELLIKVKKMVYNELSERENSLFDYIIRSYTKPS